MTLTFINPFDLLGLDASSLTEMLNDWGVETTEKVVKHWMNIAIPVIIFACLIGGILLKLWKKRQKTKRWREENIEEVLGREFGSFLDGKTNVVKKIWSFIVGRDAKHIYIETKFQSKAPHDKEDPRENVFTEPTNNLMEFYLNKVLVRDNNPHFLYCILAGSGMGKTTFAVNLVKRYFMSHTESTLPYAIHLLSLSNEDVISNIGKIASPAKSILILDALDENNDAVKDYSAFKKKLEKAIAQFRIVIITCRTQFFADEENEPKLSMLSYYDKDRTLQKYNSHYIAVFDDADIENYLKQKYQSRKKRKQAKRIVEKCKSLMVRPLLLSYIDDLLQYRDKDLVMVHDIYSILIDKWLDREVRFWESRKGMLMKDLKERLLLFSELLAVEIYQKREERGGLFITADDMNGFMKEKGFTESYSYRGRSLVNRDSMGNIKFAHKSFLEYFLALQMFKGGIIIPFEGMDMVRDFYKEQCLAEFVELRQRDKVWDHVYQNNTRVLVINDSTDFRHEHLNMIYSWQCVFVSWGTVTDALWDWLVSRKEIKRLVIFNYDGSGSLNKISRMHKLEAIMVMGDTDLGKTLQKKVRTRSEAFDFKITRGKLRLTTNEVSNIMQQMELSMQMNQRVMFIEHVNGKFYNVNIKLV